MQQEETGLTRGLRGLRILLGALFATVVFATLADRNPSGRLLAAGGFAWRLHELSIFGEAAAAWLLLRGTTSRLNALSLAGWCIGTLLIRRDLGPDCGCLGVIGASPGLIWAVWSAVLGVSLVGAVVGRIRLGALASLDASIGITSIAIGVCVGLSGPGDGSRLVVLHREVNAHQAVMSIWNPTEDPITLVEVSESCDCIEVVQSPPSIEPSSSGQIVVLFTKEVPDGVLPMIDVLCRRGQTLVVELFSVDPPL